MRVTLLLLLFITVCRTWASTESDTAYLPVRALPSTLDPAQLKIATDSYIFRQIAEGLFSVGDAFQVDPRLSKETRWSADQRRLSIELRKATFSDGSPVTATDVVDSLSYCIKNAEKTLLVAVRSIEGYSDFAQGRTAWLHGLRATDPSHIEIHITASAPLLLDDFAQADCHIVKPAKDGSRDLMKGALGSGPYVLKGIAPPDLRLERRPDYWGSLNSPRAAIFRETSDFNRPERLRDWATMMTLESSPAVPEHFRAQEFSDLGTYQLIFNNAKPPFNRDAVRKGVALALDYALLAKEMGWSAETLQTGLVPFGMTGFIRRSPGNRTADIAKANVLLRRAGFIAGHPLRFTLLLSKLPDFEKEAALWPRLFTGTPIRVSIQMLPHAERNARMNSGRFQAARGTKFAGSSESHRLLATYRSGSGYNPTRSHEPACDRLIDQAVTTSDREARFSLYEKADRCLMDRAILVPLASIQPGVVFIKEPWRLSRSNRYLLYPYWVSEWRRDESK